MSLISAKLPTILSQDSQALWQSIVDEYELDDAAALVLLEAALLSYDRMHQARRMLKREGLLITGPTGARRQHPATLIERDSRAAMLAALKGLNLDLEPLNARAGRQPGSRVVEGRVVGPRKQLGTLRPVT